MSTYHGRRAPNVSHLLQDLNTISHDAPVDDNFNMEDDLELFTNTQFYDFDSGQQTDFQAQPVKARALESATVATNTASENITAPPSAIGDMPNLDFSMNGEFAFTDFSNPYPSFPEGPQNFQPLQPNHGSVYGTPAATSPNQFPQHASQAATPKAPTPNANRPLNMEEASRQAAEEDKRRRNTAASARFRVKKKQREQALEKSAKEMSDKVSALESKVSQLETENKWLKNLLVDKNEGNEEIATMWKEFTKYAGERTKKATAAKDER